MPQPGQRLRRLALDRSDRAAHDDGGFGLGAVLEITQHDDRALPCGQLPQRAAQRLPDVYLLVSAAGGRAIRQLGKCRLSGPASPRHRRLVFTRTLWA